MICKKCGAENLDGKNFCRKCGSPLENEAAPDPVKAEPEVMVEGKKEKKGFSVLFEIISDVITAAIAALCGWLIAVKLSIISVIPLAAALVLSVVLKAVLRRRREKGKMCLIVDCIFAIVMIAAAVFILTVFNIDCFVIWGFMVAIAIFVLTATLIKIILAAKKLKKVLKTVLIILLVLALSAGEVLLFTKYRISWSDDSYYVAEPMVVDADDFMAHEALKQYESGDQTNLKTPIEYNILWIGYENVSYEKLLFTMNARDKEYLENVVVNFEHTVEKMANNNIDVNIDLHFIQEERILYSDESEKWLYLEVTEVQDDIDKYNTDGKYDTVLTTVQGEGDDNWNRREPYEEQYPSDLYYIMLGLQTVSVDYELGYSTFNLSMPYDDEIVAPDPEIPSLYGTAVAVHEWLHQFEGFNYMYPLFFPEVHCYMDGYIEQGYRTYIEGEKNYDYFELYEEILSGTVPYAPEGEKARKVGMYPKMWWLAKKSEFSLGDFTIKYGDSGLYLAADENDGLVMTEEPYKWEIKSLKNMEYAIFSSENPEYCLTVSDDFQTVALDKFVDDKDLQRFNIQNVEEEYKITPFGGQALGYTSEVGLYDESVIENGWIIEEAE